MDYSSRWQVIEEIGEGGQGKVYTVFDRQIIDPISQIKKPLIDAIKNLPTIQKPKVKDAQFESLKAALIKLFEMEDKANYGALKVLHEPKNARDPELAIKRIQSEIKAMKEIKHPNLIDLLDYDPDFKWFVSKFYPNGTMDKMISGFTGNLDETLKVFRSLVEGVSAIHKAGYVHRDIKPANIFFDRDNNPVLGDFGLVYFEDDEHTRYSNTLENVGSRDWMPPWATVMKIEDVKASFDVFSLGKVLWAMLSKKPILRLWDWDDDEFNLINMFPDNKNIWLINEVLEKCIVRYDKDCLKNADELLIVTDEAITMLDYKAQKLGDDIDRQCKVCGKGIYKMKSDGDPGRTKQWGLIPTPGHNLKVYSCDYCGHMEFFFGDPKNIPPAWD